MKALFLKRRQDFQKQQSKYLRYVFNDHFVLVLMFLFGFCLVQYSQLLKHFPSNHWYIWLFLMVGMLLLLHLGSVATYLEEPDHHFLLPKEEAVVAHIKQAERSALVIWGCLQTAILIFLYPIFNRLGFSLVTFALLLLGLLALKRLLLGYKVRHFLKKDGLDWEKAIAFESNRKQAILKFYSLFTNVKGISTKVKKRSYLNPLLKLVKENSKHLWLTLYLKAFLRSSDYLGLFLRLLLLSSLALLFISNAYLSVALALVFNYLILFQLLSLYHHYDYHYMTSLYPGNHQGKRANLLTFLRGLSCLILVINLLLCHSLEKALILVAVMGVITLFYLPYKLKKIID